MHQEELRLLAAFGESDSLEFKASTGQLRDAMKTICGMLNGAGGSVLVGVTDQGAIVGQRVSTRTMEDIAQELRRFDPPAPVDVERIGIRDGLEVIVFRVAAQRGAGPYAYDGRCYSRVGPTTRVMPEQQREHLTIERLHGTRRWENQPVPDGIDISSLDLDAVQSTVDHAIGLGRLQRVSSRDPRDLLRGLGLIAEGRLLNAAIVLYGSDPQLYPYYPQLEIRLARFRGTSRLAPFTDNRSVWGHAFEQLRRAEQFLSDHVPIAGYVRPGALIRDDRPAYAPAATREALANAICHRDYTSGGGAVTVAIYDDHLEIANPGCLRFGLTPESLHGPHESHPWNPIIARVFYLAGVIERWGPAR